MEKKWTSIIRRNAVTVLAIIVTTIYVHPAFAAPPETYHQRGEVADATFYSYEGCLMHYVQVQSHPDTTSVFVHRRDYCTGEYIMAGGSDTAVFSVNGFNAVLKGDLQVITCDDAGICEDCTVSVDLQWQGNKDTTRYRSVSWTLSPEGRSSEKLNYIGVSATATGSVLVNGSPIISAGETSEWGSIGINAMGFRTMYKLPPKGGL